MSTRIIVAGASGQMGQEVVKMILQEPSFTLVAGVSRSKKGYDIGQSIGITTTNLSFTETLEEAIEHTEADVLVDFTTPESVKKHTELAIQSGIRPVVGTTGLSSEEITELSSLCKKNKVGAIIAPNFAIGAVLMMSFAARAAEYLPHVEIIESHHDKKLDAPSGTAWKTAELITKSRPAIHQGHMEEKEWLEGARGASCHGFRIHSIRLPGLIAHQEVLLGGSGELLTIRHDSLNRKSFMPGVKMAIEKVIKLDHLVYGLEHILEL